MRLVLDTNVLISALIRDGKPRSLLKTILSKGHIIVLSEPIIEEFSRVVADKQIRRYVGAAEITGFLKTLVRSGEFVRLKSRFSVLRSTDDNMLRTANDAKVDLIATGDKHLLKLGSFRGIRIVTVSEALSYLNP